MQTKFVERLLKNICIYKIYFLTLYRNNKQTKTIYKYGTIKGYSDNTNWGVY